MRAKDIAVGIIGAGPAGISAAVQLCRSDFPVRLFEGGTPGGLIRNAWRVENLSVCPAAPGSMVADRLAASLEQSGAELVRSRVLRVEYEEERDVFVVQCTRGEYRFHTLLVASGTRPGPWPLQDEAEAVVKGYLHRQVAGLDSRGGVWGVVGSGDAAFDYALSLNERGASVVLLVRGEQVRALPRLQREVFSRRDGIRFRTRTSCVEAGLGTEKPLRLKIQTDQKPETLDLDGLVGAIGRVPSVEFLSGAILRDSAQLRRAGRLFSIGDVNGGRFRQVGIALGEGLQAAMRVVAIRNQTEE